MGGRALRWANTAPEGRDPQAVWDEGILLTCVHLSCHASAHVFPTAALHRHRLIQRFITEEVNTVKHAMLTRLSAHCVITQLANTVCKT